MRLEHIAVGFIIFLIVLAAFIMLTGKTIPIFSSGMNEILKLVNLK